MGGVAMLTEFGKELRKLRLDHDEYLKNMADKLKVSVAYLSAVETGKRKIPDDFISKIITAYNLTDKDANLLNNLKEISASEVRVPLTDKTMKQKEAILSFAKAINEIDNEELDKIMRIMNGKG